MINRLFIDGNDAYLQYGVYVTSGGFNELVAFPPLKSVESQPLYSTPVKFRLSSLSAGFSAVFALSLNCCLTELTMSSIAPTYSARSRSE